MAMAGIVKNKEQQQMEAIIANIDDRTDLEPLVNFVNLNIKSIQDFNVVVPGYPSVLNIICLAANMRYDLAFDILAKIAADPKLDWNFTYQGKTGLGILAASTTYFSLDDPLKKQIGKVANNILQTVIHVQGAKLKLNTILDEAIQLSIFNQIARLANDGLPEALKMVLTNPLFKDLNFKNKPDPASPNVVCTILSACYNHGQQIAPLLEYIPTLDAEIWNDRFQGSSTLMALIGLAQTNVLEAWTLLKRVLLSVPDLNVNTKMVAGIYAGNSPMSLLRKMADNRNLHAIGLIDSLARNTDEEKAQSPEADHQWHDNSFPPGALHHYAMASASSSSSSSSSSSASAKPDDSGWFSFLRKFR